MVDPHAFMDALREFHHSQGEDLKAPIFNRKVMDLKKLWELVYAHGGSNQVCLKKRWASIGRCFNPPTSMTNLSFHIKRIYEKYLLPFEQLHFPARVMYKTNDTSSQSSSNYKPQCISPPFNSDIYIPKKRRSKLSRESRFAKNKKTKHLSNTLEPQGKRNRSQTKSIDPKEFAVPQTLVRPSTELSIDDYEFQAVSALQEMKNLSKLTYTTLKDHGVQSKQPTRRYVVDDCTPFSHLHQVRSNSAEECSFDESNDILLSNGIRVVPIKSPNGINSMMNCSVLSALSEDNNKNRNNNNNNNETLSRLDETEVRLANIEERQRQDVESLSFQIQQIQALMVRQEAKLQNVEASCHEVKQCLQALFSGFHRGGVNTPSPPTQQPPNGVSFS
eukprot:g6810.t1